MLGFYGINWWLCYVGTLTPVFLSQSISWRGIHCKERRTTMTFYCLLCGSCFPLDSCIGITLGLVPLPLSRPPGNAGELTVFFLQETCYDWWSREGSNLYRTCWPPGYSRVPFLSGVYSINLVASRRIELLSIGYQPIALPLSYEAIKTWRCVGESNSRLRIDNPR